MGRTRLYLGIVLAALGALGAWWAVSAQEIFLPPPVLQPEGPPAVKPADKKASVPASAKYPLPAPPLRDKAKADPTLIIPPEAYDIPHPLPGPLENKPGLELTGGVIVPPLTFPPPPIAPPPSLPMLDPQAVTLPELPAPPPEPTKMLIEPLTQDPPVKETADAPPPPPRLVFPPAATQAPVAPVELPKSFVRLHTNGKEVKSPPIDVIPGPPLGGARNGPVAPPPVLAEPNPPALVNLQTPAIGVEKRGAAILRPGEPQNYQIVVRNLGAVPAQQVRIEEEIPPGARVVAADPQPQWQGAKAIWTLTALAPGSAQILRLSLQAEVALQLGVTTSAHVSAMPAINTTALRPQNPPASPMAVRMSGPERAIVGKPIAFDIHVTNQSGLPLTGVVLFGYLPEGLIAPGLLDEHGQPVREIEGAVAGVIPPGGVKILKMPANAVKPGRYSVGVKLKSSAGAAAATATIDIAADSLTVQQAELTRLYLGRDGELRIDVANGTDKPLQHVQVACQLPEGLDYLGSSEHGMYQGNHRIVYWLINSMPAGQTKTLAISVAGTRPGQFQNIVSVRADGVAEIRSTGTVALEGIASLKVRVVDRDNPLELGKDTVYEIQIRNSGGTPAHNVRLQVQFPPGLIPGSAQGNTRYAVERQTVTFDAVSSLPADGQPVVYRVSAHAQSAGDQRVRFAVVSDEVQTPLVREVSTKVY